MSSIQDPENPNPKGGDGPNQDPQSGGDRVSGASGEHRQDEGRGEQGGRGEGGGRPGGDDAPKTASKGINPVQHSE
jgi:hypothetical protein